MMPLGSPGDSLSHPESDMPDTANEAAERLRACAEQWAERNHMVWVTREAWLDMRRLGPTDAALAAERRATVERIRLRKCNQRFGDVGKTCLRRAGHSGGHYWATDGTAFGATDDRELAWLDAILDEEAAR